MTNRFRRWALLGVVISVLLTLGHIYAQEVYPTHRVTGIAWNDEGSLLAMGNADGTVTVMNTITLEVWQLGSHQGAVHNLAWSSDNRRLASVGASPDNSLRIWDVLTRRQTLQIASSGTDLYAVGWKPYSEYIWVIPIEGDGQVIEASTGTTLSTFDAGSTSKILWDVPLNHAILADALGVVLLDVDGLTITQVVNRATSIDGQAVSLAWNPETNRVASGTHIGTVYIWHKDTGELLFEQKGNEYSGSEYLIPFIVALRFSEDGSTLSSISGDGTYRVWDVATQTIIEDRRLPAPIYAADWSPDGTKLAYGGADGVLHIEPVVVNAPTPTPMPTIIAPPHGGDPVCPDGSGGVWTWIDG
ncbi:MAG: hypothetical protein IAE83_00015, partial [Anaerolinea sp.]|nr:hypothetical protein [Anaerolinea sp.]